MDLELATLNDMVEELRHRGTRFVLVAVEPNNHASTATVMHAAQGMDVRDLVGLVKMAWLEVMRQSNGGAGAPPVSMN